jgi:hypothetical protein
VRLRGKGHQQARINISTAFADNLMGALFGGVMEYNSMYFGSAFLSARVGILFPGLGVFMETRAARTTGLVAPVSSAP